MHQLCQRMRNLGEIFDETSIVRTESMETPNFRNVLRDWPFFNGCDLTRRGRYTLLGYDMSEVFYFPFEELTFLTPDLKSGVN